VARCTSGGKENDVDGQEMSAILDQIGWSPAVLAGRLNVRVGSVYDWLTGRRTIPPNLADWLRRLRDAQGQVPSLPDGWRSG
jgi:DNA-binding transcriptional regulator YiaG